MTQRKIFTDLSDVDASGSAARYTLLNDQVRESMQAHKTRSHALLELRAGQRVLEVGAGTGEDAVALARRVAPGGRVVAIDTSHDLLREARRRVAGTELAVELRHGDVQALEFADATFDACRAERVFQHLADPGAALAEMVRVTRQGGRVAVLDADYETMVIDASDGEVSRAVIRRRADAASNGRIGRQLPRRMRDAGLEVVAVEGVTFPCTDRALAFEIFELDTMAEAAVDDGELPRERVEAWRSELIERGRTGRFLLASTGFLVVGRKR